MHIHILKMNQHGQYRFYAVVYRIILQGPPPDWEGGLISTVVLTLCSLLDRYISRQVAQT